MWDSVFRFYAFVFISHLSWNVAKGEGLLSNPSIGFTKNQDYNTGWSSYNVNVSKLQNNVYVVPPSLSNCVLVCNASYPITWEFHNVHLIGHAPWMLNVRTRRTARIIYDVNTYEYTAILYMYGNYNRLTGNYTCRHTARGDVKSSVYVYWQDTSYLRFIQANETIVVYAEDNVAVLPCKSADPKFKNPMLQKAINETDMQPIAYNKSVRFEKMRGVILDNIPSLEGNYTCVVNEANRKYEFVTVQVKVRNESQISTGSKKSNASLTYDRVKSTITCCSNTRHSPTLLHYYCNHPTMCEFRKHFVTQETYTAKGKKSRRSCTTVKLYIHAGGLVHCIGDGIDAFMSYIFSLRNWYLPQEQQTQFVYFDWSEINPHELMLIHMYSSSTNRYNVPYASNQLTPLYNGQQFSFSCYASEYYFSEGIQWAIKWKNETLQLKQIVYKFGTNYRYDSTKTLRVTGHVDMEAIICMAPVWNSTEYIHKQFLVYINESSKAVINETLEETHTWTMNDTNKEITCSAFGIPIPKITWEKLDEWWHPSHINVNHNQSKDESRNVTWESIKIDRVSYTSNGTYMCTASNFGGMMQRKIHIFVIEPASWKKRVGVIVGVSLSLVLLTGIILMLWKLRKDRLAIRQLSTAITFKDGSIRPEPPTTATAPVVPATYDDFNNSTVDPKRLSTNLID